jgi:hypothetical protein
MNALKAFKKLLQIEKQEAKLSKLKGEYLKLKDTINSGDVFELDGNTYVAIKTDKGYMRDVSYTLINLK